MSLLIVSLLVIGAALVAAKVYFQEKEKQAIENQKAEDAAEQNLLNPSKTNEDIVAERLAEIAEFEKEVDVVKQDKKEVIAPTPVVNKTKSKQSGKKYYKPKKQQPKIKTKQ